MISTLAWHLPNLWPSSSFAACQSAARPLSSAAISYEQLKSLQTLGDDVSRIRDLGRLAAAARAVPRGRVSEIQRAGEGLDLQCVRHRLADRHVLRRPTGRPVPGAGKI